MSKNISVLSAGSLVKLNENGVAKKYIMLGYNHYGKAEVTLLRKDAVGPRVFNVGPSRNSMYDGNPLDSFCNEQHIQCLDPIIRACLVNVPIPVLFGTGPVRNLMRKCFSLSRAEAGVINPDGTAFSYLGKQTNRIAYQDEATKPADWWLRSPQGAENEYFVVSDGSISYLGTETLIFARPALALSSEISVSDNTDGDGCYIIDGANAGENYRKINGKWLRMV